MAVSILQSACNSVIREPAPWSEGTLSILPDIGPAWASRMHSAGVLEEPTVVHSIRRHVSVACQAGESASSVSMLPEKR